MACARFRGDSCPAATLRQPFSRKTFPLATKQQIGTVASASAILAIGSFIATCTGHPIWGLVAGLLSLPAGAFGFLRAASPRVRGGFISLGALILGLLAIGVAVLGMLGKLAALPF